MLERNGQVSRTNTVRTICFVAMITALAFVAVAFGRIPAVLFLKYEPKDVILLMGGLLFGPTLAFVSTIICCFIEMLTISSTGGWGLLLNIISSLSFVMVPLVLWTKKKTMKNLVVGLIYATIIMTILMLLWNFIVTPIYMNTDRSKVIPLLLPAILPFNLIKALINSGLVLLLYTPVSKALAPLLKRQDESQTVYSQQGQRLAYYIAGAFLIITGALCIYFLRG